VWLDSVGVPAAGVTVRRGTAWVELVRVADERDAQVIVVGTHGQSGFHPITLGSTATRIALLSARPTVLVGDRPRRDRHPAVKLPDLFDHTEL
jgi:nucleotide-binding universal stress UspA family protein